MNKVIIYMQRYLIVGFPFVLALMAWSTTNPEMVDLVGFTFKNVLWQILAFNLMFWFFVLVLFLVSLIVMPSVRENTLRHLANIKERDEREQFITGKAARSAYISSLGLLIFLLFFSVFTLNVSYLPENPAGKRGQMKIGVHFNLFENQPVAEKQDEAKTLLTSTNYSLSKTTIILILLGWQLATFNLVARREREK